MKTDVMKVSDDFVTLVLSLSEVTETLDILVRLNKEDLEYEASFSDTQQALKHYKFLRRLFNL